MNRREPREELCMNELKMKMRLEREAALTGSQNDAYLFLEVEAPKDERADSLESKRLELALVDQILFVLLGDTGHAVDDLARRVPERMG